MPKEVTAPCICAARPPSYVWTQPARGPGHEEHHVRSIQDLIAYVCGDLGPEAAAGVEAWLAAAPSAAVACSELVEVLDAIRARDSGAGPSPRVLERLHAAFTECAGDRPRRVPGRMHAGREIEAGTVLDTRDRVALAGFRGGGDGYQLVLASTAADIDLQVCAPRGGEGRWVVLGQIEQEGVEARGTVFVWRPGDEEVTWEVESDEYGVFRLELPAGRYNVSVLIGNVGVRLPPLDIG
jgi:anti-sigma factor RsiW